MKELAEQAATGTYDSVQRLMIDSEFQQMASEINRIAHATDFNGIHLLNGNLSGKHNGSGLTSTGAMKVHFGSGNDSTEDYYYVEIGDCTTAGLGLNNTEKIKVKETVKTTEIQEITKQADYGDTKIMSDVISNGVEATDVQSGIRSFAIIPKGSKNINIKMWSGGHDDDIELFYRNGEHIIGTTPNSTPAWQYLTTETQQIKMKIGLMKIL